MKIFIKWTVILQKEDQCVLKNDIFDIRIFLYYKLLKYYTIHIIQFYTDGDYETIAVSLFFF